MGIAEDLIIIILAGLATGLVSSKIKVPPIIGYIIAGIIIGPYTGGITVSDIPRIELLAEIGVALLLFSIGLDFSFKELKAVKGIALIGAPVQVVIHIIFGSLIGRFMDMPWNVSLIFGMVISLSSTMVVLKTLMGRGLMGTLSSRVMIGVLIIQDLAAIPLMLVIPKLGSINESLVPLGLTMLKAAVILGAIILIGARIIPRFLTIIARLNSRELFLITITSIGLGVGYLTHIFGLSLAFGAFVAGMVINESDYSRQALNDIIPLRDIFGLVFFTSIGMLLDPAYVRGHLSLIMVLVALVIAGKFTVFFLLSLAFRYYNIIPLALGFGLCQIGEFSFVLANTAVKSSIIDNDFYSLVLSVSVITMIASPFLSLLAVPLYSLKRKWFRNEPLQTVNIPAGMKGHIIIAGGGRVGFQIAAIFRRLDFPFIIIEQDFRRFERSKGAGFPAIYGDAGLETVLHGAKIDASRLVIITVPFPATARNIIAIAKNRNSDIKIIARADNLTQLNELYRMNIFDVIQPEFEASLEIIRKSLVHLEVPLTAIYGYTEDIRKENYPDIKPVNGPGKVLDTFRETPFLLDTGWYEIKKDGPLSGRSIGEMGIRSRTGVSIVGILRNNEFIPNPDAGFVFHEGDYIAIIGMPENKKSFNEMMISSTSEGIQNNGGEK